MSAMERRGARAGITLLVLFGIGAVAWVLWHFSAGPNDFSQDYFAARALFRGGSIYGQEVVELGRERFGTISPANFHPPTLIVFFSPLAWLPYRLAYLVFGILNVGLFAGSLVLATRTISTFPHRPALLLAVLLWAPFWICLTHGQVSMMVAAALTASWLCDQRGKPGAAGAMAGLAVLLKIFPALVALYFLIRKDRRALISMMLVVAGGLAVSWVAVGTDDVVRYATEAAPESASAWSSHPLNVSLHSAMQNLLGDPFWAIEPLIRAPEAARFLTLVAGMGILAVTAIRGALALRHTIFGNRRLFAGICVAALLLSPLTWSHTLAVAFLPLVVEFSRQESTRGRLFVLALGFLLIGFPGPPLGKLVVPLFAGDPVPWYVAAVFQAPAVGLVILWWRLILGRS